MLFLTNRINTLTQIHAKQNTQKKCLSHLFSYDKTISELSQLMTEFLFFFHQSRVLLFHQLVLP